jgi:hypothetical protein
VTLLIRHPLSVAIVALAVVATAGVFTFARPTYRPPGSSMSSVKMPEERPPADAAGAAGWVWPDGVPGWDAANFPKNFDMAGVQPAEIAAAQLAAAHEMLDGSSVRVVSAIRGNRRGPLMILAASTTGSTPAPTCLAPVLLGAAEITWRCSGSRPKGRDLAHSRVLVAAACFLWPSSTPGGERPDPIYLAGVARGDVYRIVLHGEAFTPMTIYTRGKTWGQFSAVTPTNSRRSHLAVYGRHKLLETIRLDLVPGQQRVFG